MADDNQNNDSRPREEPMGSQRPPTSRTTRSRKSQCGHDQNLETGNAETNTNTCDYVLRGEDAYDPTRHVLVSQPGLVNGSPGNAIDPVFGVSLRLFEHLVKVGLEGLDRILKLFDLLLSNEAQFQAFQPAKTLCADKTLKAALREKLPVARPKSLEVTPTIGNMQRAELRTFSPSLERQGEMKDREEPSLDENQRTSPGALTQKAAHWHSSQLKLSSLETWLARCSLLGLLLNQGRTA
uniref:Uncharacterized protein n=1 Tax=Cannabis sativa TaxID=3483 RepID=A0A803Q697_CANSA